VLADTGTSDIGMLNYNKIAEFGITDDMINKSQSEEIETANSDTHTLGTISEIDLLIGGICFKV